jgi:hypothetical protein
MPDFLLDVIVATVLPLSTVANYVGIGSIFIYEIGISFRYFFMIMVIKTNNAYRKNPMSQEHYIIQ